MKRVILIVFCALTIPALYAQKDSIMVQDVNQIYNPIKSNDRAILDFPLPDFSNRIQYVFPDTVMKILYKYEKTYDSSFAKSLLLFSDSSNFLLKFIAYPIRTVKLSDKNNQVLSNRVCKINNSEIPLFLESDFEFSFLSKVIFKGYIISIEFQKTNSFNYDVKKVYLDIIYD